MDTAVEATEEPPPCPSYFEWTEIYPQLQVLIDNYDAILEEVTGISTVSPSLFIYAVISFFLYHLLSGPPGPRTITPTGETRTGRCSLSCTPFPPTTPPRVHGCPRPVPPVRALLRCCDPSPVSAPPCLVAWAATPR